MSELNFEESFRQFMIGEAAINDSLWRRAMKEGAEAYYANPQSSLQDLVDNFVAEFYALSIDDMPEVWQQRTDYIATRQNDKA